MVEVVGCLSRLWKHYHWLFKDGLGKFSCNPSLTRWHPFMRHNRHYIPSYYPFSWINSLLLLSITQFVSSLILFPTPTFAFPHTPLFLPLFSNNDSTNRGTGPQYPANGGAYNLRAHNWQCWWYEGGHAPTFTWLHPRPGLLWQFCIFFYFFLHTFH